MLIVTKKKPVHPLHITYQISELAAKQYQKMGYDDELFEVTTDVFAMISHESGLIWISSNESPRLQLEHAKLIENSLLSCYK
jgi:hypothetical protein